MQLDLFGATEETAVQKAAPPVISGGEWWQPEEVFFSDALRGGKLGDAIRILNHLDLDAAAKVLLGAGFSLGSIKNRAKMMADVQSELVRAARLGVDGHGLRRSATIDERNDHGGALQFSQVSKGDGGQDRGDGGGGDLDRQSLDAGLAAAGGGADSGGSVSAEAAGAGGSREGGAGERAELSASGAVRAVEDVRDPGSAADGGLSVDRSVEAAEGDFALTDEDGIGVGSLREKYQDNIQAIRILKDLAAEGRNAVDSERKALARYVGWGGMKGVFDPDNKQWSRQHRELRSLLSEEEWAAARRSQLDAFYTPSVVAQSMYSAVERLGFEHGRVLEPSVGVGNFFGFMPEEMRRSSNLHGVELDILTSRISQALYPKAQISAATGFQHYNVPAGYFDMVIGNPPFGNQSIADERGSVYSGWSIHNYFFAKSIDMLRPGGIMPMVVSHNFLDKLDPHVRKWIARRAELVSGVRLPNTAFKENANTDVVTDVLIFKRIDLENTLGEQEMPSWLSVSDLAVENPKTGEVETVRVNNYFIEHPENVLGVNSVTSSQFRANEYTVLENGDLQAQLAEWVERLPRGIYRAAERSAAEMETSAVEVPDHVKEGCFYLAGEEVYRRLPDAFGLRRSSKWEAPNQRAYERMVGMVRIRDVLREQMWLERTREADAPVIEEGRRALNRVYDEFQRKFGFLNDPTNRRLFIDDTESALVQALEFDYEKAITPAKAEELGVEVRPARAVKADIFKQRVLFPPVQVENVENAKDALLHSLNLKGQVDLDYMQSLYDRPEEEIVQELGDLLFYDPVRGQVTADEYLSGDVKTKLVEAEKAAEGNVVFKRNVEALKAVIPADKMPSEIHIALGAAWVPNEVFQAFAKEISGADVTFSYVGATAQWLEHSTSSGDYAKNKNDYGTEHMSAVTILTHMMNSRGLEVKKRVEIDGHDKYVTDEAATEAVKQKADKIKAHWESWVWMDGERVDSLTKIYNDRFNRVVERRFDGSHLTLPGMSMALSLLAHQKNGVWRGLQDRNMLLDHVVGAGKTFTIAAVVMEMRRLGIAKKPMIAVPNHLTLQWRSEIYRLYPGANILAATPQDFEKDNRERLFSKIVTGNWDAVVVGHSSLTKIKVPFEAENKILQEQIDDISDAIEDMKRERGDRNIIRDMEKIKSNLEAKIARLKEKGGKKDNVVDFADLGVDALLVDEMHEFKNLFFTTQMNRVSGLGNPAGSGKAFDLFVKIQWLQDTFGENAPLITATGTPVSNSMAEMFTMQRFMHYGQMKDQGLHLFDAWAKQYGDVQNVYEVAPSGTGYRLSQRFAKFKNLGSLMGDYQSFADIITLDDLKAQEIARGGVFPVPKVAGGRPLNVVANRSELQEKFFGIPEIVRNEAGEIQFEYDLSLPTEIVQNKSGKWVIEQLLGASPSSYGNYETQEEAAYMLALGATTPLMKIDPNSIIGQFENLRELTRKSEGKINALSLTSLANKAGLDYRLIDPNAPDFEGSKINQAIGKMMSTYRKWEADKGTQLVFCDLSVPLSAKAKMAAKDKRVYVRDGAGALIHKRGTLHTVKEYEGFPYYLVPEGKGSEKAFTMYDPVSGKILKEGFDDKKAAHEFAAAFLKRENGPVRWLEIREQFRAIEPEEIEDYKNEHSIDVDGDAADVEFSLQDIEGVACVTGFSVYDDMKAKLIASGVPVNEIEFIHDHDTPQAKDLLFKRVNSGEVRFLFGSTPKMGAGTNVQKRLVGLHHIDAPWRPSDLEQREGRIIRRGNMLYERDSEGFEVNVNRYATSQTYDTRRWQLLEHKASGIEQLRNYNGENEIEDVATEASNAADMKAAASGNPLILKETQLATEIKKLRLLEKGHRDGEYMVRMRMNDAKNHATIHGPKWLAELEGYKAARDSAQVLAVYGGRALHDKEAVVDALGKVADRLDALGAKEKVVFRGIPFEFAKESVSVICFVAPGGRVSTMEKLSPSGAFMRMENACNELDLRIVDLRDGIARSAKKAEEYAGLLGKPFEHVELLKATVAEHGKVQRALMKSNSMSAVKPDEMKEFVAVVARQKEKLRTMGFGVAVDEIEREDVVEKEKAAPAAPGLVLDGADVQFSAASAEVGDVVDVGEDMKHFIQIAADSVGELRKIDVYRVFDELSNDKLMAPLSAYIKKHRPDLADEVDSVLSEIGIEVVDPPMSKEIEGAGTAGVVGALLSGSGALSVTNVSVPEIRKAFVHGGREVYPVLFDGNEGWAVQSEANRLKGVRGEEDAKFVGMEEAIQAAERLKGQVKSMGREDIAARYAAALNQGEPGDYHFRFADSVLKKDAYALDFLANGLNDVGKRVFSEVTGVALPKQQGATWAVLRDWGGISVEEDAKNRTWQKVVSERRAIEATVGLDALQWANEQVEKGFDTIQKIGRDTWLVNVENRGFNLSVRGSGMNQLVPYLKAKIEHEKARADWLAVGGAQVESEGQAVEGVGVPVEPVVGDVSLSIAGEVESSGFVMDEREKASWRAAGESVGTIEAIEKVGCFEKIRASGKLNGEWQDVLDSAFQKRMIDVRNHLREAGWDGPRFGILMKENEGERFRVDIQCSHYDDLASNVVDFKFSVRELGSPMDRVLEVVDNDMCKSAAELAAEIDGVVLGRMLQASMEAGDQEIESQVKNAGASLEIKEPAKQPVSAGEFCGVILSVEKGVATQKIDREGNVAHHQLSKLSEKVRQGDFAIIRYKMGMGVVNVKEKGAALAR